MSRKGVTILAICCAVLIVIAAAGAVILLRSGYAEGGRTVFAGLSPEPVYTPAPTIPVVGTNVTIATATPDLEAEARSEAKLITARLTMLDGLTIGGIDVSGLTVQQAREKLNDALGRTAGEPRLVLLVDGQPYSPDEKEKEKETVSAEFAGEVDDPDGFTVTPDIEHALEAADTMLRDGDYHDVLLEAENIRKNGIDVPVKYLLDEEDVRLYIASVAQDVDRQPVNATIKSTGKKVEYVDEVPGYGIDQEALTAQLLSADFSVPQTIEVPMTELQPPITRHMLETTLTRRGKYSTSFSGSTGNRKYNIRKGADLINGTVLHPGDVFSTNATLGVRSKKNGWKTAGAYEAGQVVQQAGGGVCQLSGTLYNAVLYADLEIVERRNHSMPVHYLDKGRDATINSVGNIIDFKFRNNTEADIILIGYTDGNDLTFEIYGVDRGWDDVTITTKRKSTIRYKTNYIDDPDMEEGQTKTEVKGVTGYVVETYVTYTKDGKSEKKYLDTSNYKSFPATVRRGTKHVEHEKPEIVEGGSGEQQPIIVD